MNYLKPSRIKKKEKISTSFRFNLSVVMPFYKRLDVFKTVLPRNAPFLQRAGIEVIIVLDSPEEEEDLLALIKEYPLINWKLIVNDYMHETRNPAPVLNVGIRNAGRKFILVSDPEVEFLTDVISQLYQLLLSYPRHYAIGTVAFIDEKSIIADDNNTDLWFMKYGSIMAEAKYFRAIRGYDESFLKWGGEDDNIRIRLDMLGVRKLLVPQAKSLHREKILKLEQRLNKTSNFSTKHLKKIIYPQAALSNGSTWGKSFGRISYSGENDPQAKNL